MLSSLALYQRLPDALQHLACSLEGWRIHRDRYSAEFLRLLGDLEGRARWNQDYMQEFRSSRLRTTLMHAASHSPFYRERFRLAGLDPAASDLPDLQCLPVLSKVEVKTNQSALRVTVIPQRTLRNVHTSGTTGGGLHFVTTANALREQWAVWWRYRRWHGIQLDTWCAYFGGRSLVRVDSAQPPFWRYNVPGRQIMFSTYHLRRSNLPAYIGELRRQRVPWLHGYPSALALLAAYIVDTGMDLGYDVQWITTGAETLMMQQRLLITRAFGIAPRQHYGMAEAAANISECQMGRLHVDEDFAAVEFIPTGDASTYRIIGTNLSNPATPLIRYEVGDTVTPDHTGCSCGRPGRTVAAIDGRMEDYVLLPNGARIGRLDHAFKDLVNVQEAQIHQRRVGEITLRIVRGVNYSRSDEELILAEVKQRIGNDTHIMIEYVGSVERSSSSKLRFVISELSEARIDAPCI